MEEKKQEQEQDHPLKALIKEYAQKGGDKPFLKHVSFFKDKHGDITRSTIATKWSVLENIWYLKAWIFGKVTIDGANQQAANECTAVDSSGKCPWKTKDTFTDAGELMGYLKHPRDSGIVNKDGSINLENLEKIMLTYFEYDADRKTWFVRKSQFHKELDQTAIRDKDLPAKLEGALVGWDTVTRNEWNTQFKILCSGWIKTADGGWEETVSAQHFLEFYFMCDVLYARCLNKELPVVKPSPYID